MERHFVSYPKSGRSWIRYILVQLGIEEQILFHHDGFEFSDVAKPAHNFNLHERLDKYSRVEKLVYLERDPRDVMVSLFFQVTGRMKDVFGYTGSISEFFRDDYFGAHNLKLFRKMWDEIILHKQFLKITYEECHHDMDGTVRKVLAYHGFDVDPSSLSQSIAGADFSKMRDLEHSGTFPEPWLRPRNEAPKVRKGKVGGFRDELADEDIAYLDSIFRA